MRLRRPGGEITYQVWGQGPALFLSHGVIENADSWAEMAPHLERHFQVVVHDARGRGESGWDGAAFGFEDLAADVEALAEHLGARSIFHVGHSMGGRVALEHALLYPSRVAAVAAVSARSEAPDEAGRLRLRALIDDAESLGSGAAISLWTDSSESEYERVRTVSEANGVAGTVAALRALVEMAPLLPRLADLAAPTLIVTGAKDAAYVRSAELMAATLPRATLRIVPGVGHFPNLQCPELLASQLLEFWRSVASG
ncbi:MAG TPA: alpha/beta hydrolase [Candidatus Acidoferrales bacterium]|nr:alpha/beta hydrolase [Candidatus Acidoferrales bacterium]